MCMSGLSVFAKLWGGTSCTGDETAGAERMFSSEKDAEGKVFSFGDVTISSLRKDFNQRVVKSILLIFARIRAHHGKYAASATDRSKCLEFLKQWSRAESWNTTMVIVTAQDSSSDMLMSGSRSNVHAWQYVRACMHVCVLACLCACMFSCVCLHVCVHVCMCMYMC